MKILDNLLSDATAGDPISGLKWTRKTLRQLSHELKRKGFGVGRDTIRRLLRTRGYAQRTNRKRLTKKQVPDRDRQMRYLARVRRTFIQAGFPVISIDAKKRELIGNFKNAGRSWRKKNLVVLENDFPHEADGIAIPYGVYDVAHNLGMVSIGVMHQTAAFAIRTIRTWWLKIGRDLYRHRKHLLIEADCGGANGNRSLLWKWGLQQLADEFGLSITVTHLPTGASKWNPIEHRMFCYISQNWAGQPLQTYETVLKFIRTTKTETGFRCRAYCDTARYETGLKITKKQKTQIILKSHRVLPKWNYTIKPHKK